jgi:prepilin-type N-terminal cleavage/methylation domain-containing protein
MTHVTGWKLGRYARFARSARGFTLVEIFFVLFILGILAGVTVLIMPGIIRIVKGEGATMQAKGFLTKVREIAVTKRRNIQVTFVEPNQLTAEEMPIPGVGVAADRFLETVEFEGGLEYLKFTGIPDTPDLFGMDSAVTLGGAETVLFTSEGMFTDINGDPVNATLAFGIPEQPRTAQAVTILGVSAVVRQWRWNGSAWTQ